MIMESGYAARNRRRPLEDLMPTNGEHSAREALLAALLRKVESDTYPSTTMLDIIESLLTEDEVPGYVQFLVDRIDEDLYPSIPMIRRVQALV